MCHINHVHGHNRNLSSTPAENGRAIFTTLNPKAGLKKTLTSRPPRSVSIPSPSTLQTRMIFSSPISEYIVM